MSAGPPARTKDTKIPSLLSPPTILNPRPDDPFLTTTLLGSLKYQQKQLLGKKQAGSLSWLALLDLGNISSWQGIDYDEETY